MDIDLDPAGVTPAPAPSARPKRAYNRRVEPVKTKAQVADPAPVIARTPIRTEVRERKRKNDSSTDIFGIPAHLIPAGTSLEWKRESTLGAEDPHYMVSLHEQGWRPVDVSMIPELMPEGYKGAIRMKGMLLMERPMELTREAQREDALNARRAVQAKEQQLGATPAGTLSRDHPSARANTFVNKSVEPGTIPD